MSVSLAYPNSPSHRSGREDTHEVMCWIKRSAYELAFAVPQAPHVGACGARPRVYVRMKTPSEDGSFILDMPDVERFYGDLRQMIEYMQSERRKAGQQPPGGADVLA